MSRRGRSGSAAGFSLRAPAPFELRLAALGHGWFDLPPFRWDDARGVLAVALDLGTGGREEPADVEIRQRGGALRVAVQGVCRIDAAQRARARQAVAAMLRFDQDLGPFWALCARHERLRWAAARGAGRLLRGSTVFEDLLKLLFTTNCSWAATRKMTERTVLALGARTPADARTFPSAARCAGQPASFWRNEVRAGYRAAACAELAEGFAGGRLTDASFADPGLPAAELRRRLLAIRGFGPYAAGQAMRLLGHYEDLALDSWCRARFAALRGRKRPPSDRAIAREYRAWGSFAGLALWLDLTSSWHNQPVSDTLLRSTGV